MIDKKIKKRKAKFDPWKTDDYILYRYNNYLNDGGTLELQEFKDLYFGDWYEDKQAAATNEQQQEADRLWDLELKKMELDPDYIPKITDPEKIVTKKRFTKAPKERPYLNVEGMEDMLKILHENNPELSWDQFLDSYEKGELDIKEFVGGGLVGEYNDKEYNNRTGKRILDKFSPMQISKLFSFINKELKNVKSK